MGYTEVYRPEDILKLHDGLEIIERFIEGSELYALEMWLYGICNDEDILNVAKEAILNIDEKDVELTEIAIAVRLSADHINLLYDRGFPLEDLDFAYQSGDSEGIRTTGFRFASLSSVNLKISKLSELAFANNDYDLDDFLKDKGTGATLKLPVARNEEATTEEPVELGPEIPKQTSLKVSNLKSIVEDFLGG